MYSRRYCGYCSNKPEDIRLLQITGDKIKCLTCGKESDLKPFAENSAYVYIKRLTNGRRNEDTRA